MPKGLPCPFWPLLVPQGRETGPLWELLVRNHIISSFNAPSTAHAFSSTVLPWYTWHTWHCTYYHWSLTPVLTAACTLNTAHCKVHTAQCNHPCILHSSLPMVSDTVGILAFYSILCQEPFFRHLTKKHSYNLFEFLVLFLLPRPRCAQGVKCYSAFYSTPLITGLGGAS